MNVLGWSSKSEEDNKEKRTHNRYESNVPAALSADEHREMVKIYNISETGCAINSLHPHYLENKIYVLMEVIYSSKAGELYISQAPIEGRIVRQVKKVYPRFFGIKFIDEINEINAVKLILEDIKKEHFKRFGGL